MSKDHFQILAVVIFFVHPLEFALPPEHYKISPTGISAKEKDLRSKQRFGKTVKSGEDAVLNSPSKLCLTFIEKKNYIISLDFLDYLTTLGVKVSR